MGKAVVTANKHVIAHHGPELEAIARRTGRRAALRGGGRRRDPGPRAAGRATWRRTGSTRVRGIVNGTTNFILTAMTDATGPLDYATALAEAQRLGYAEADPSGDVEGLDAVNKLVILARLAFGRWLDPAAIATPARRCATARPAPGITDGQRSATQARCRGAPGRIIRLVATASRRPRTAAIARRGPADGAAARLAARPDGRRAATGSRSTPMPVGRVGFDGPGAGGAATSSAVLGDLIAVARGRARRGAGAPPPRRSRDEPSAAPSRDVSEAASGVRYPIDD